VVAVSAPDRQTRLEDDHQKRRVSDDLGELFRAHRSPIFHRLAQQAAGIARDGAQESREVPPSLDTCEQLPIPAEDRSPSGDYPLTIEEAGHVSTATEALQAGLARQPSRQEKIQRLVEEGEAPHAKRLALCQRQSVQLRCPHMAGGCGCEDNFVPTSCDSRLCPTCMNRRMGRAIQKYEGLVEAMDQPTLLTLTIENVEDLAQGKEAIQGAFGRLRRRVIPPKGEQGEKRWVWRRDGGAPADDYWKSALTGARQHDLAREVQTRYVDADRGIPFSDLIEGGFYGIDIKEQEPGRYHVHLHAICDMAYVPQAALSSVWEDLTGAPVVDVRRIDERGGYDTESALAEVVGYVCKPPSFATTDAEVEYLTALKDARLVQPFGSLHGNTPDVSGLLRCSNCERAPMYWDYLGFTDGHYDTMTASAPQEDRPPPEDSG
jgi:hypothetical protein